MLKGIRAEVLSPTRLVSWTLVTLLGGIGGPFSTYTIENVPLRMLYWAIVSAATILICAGLRTLLCQMFPRLWIGWISVITGVILAAVLTPLLVRLTPHLMSSTFMGRAPGWQVFFVIAAVPPLIEWLRAVTVSAPAGGGGGSGAAPPRLLRRLPEAVQGDILHLAGRDHHVDVRTSAGTHSIRLRLRDAVLETEGVEGLCVHRSHWVALAAVVGHEWHNRRPRLILSDGTRVPVGRKFEAEVRARGLLG